MELTGPAPTVLYAEDDENDVFFMTRAFAKAGYPHLAIAPTGRAAVDTLGAALAPAGAQDRPAMVILDLNLPFLTGHEVLAWLRQQPAYAALPVVVFTSSAQHSDIERAYAAGASAYVTKPNAAPLLTDFARLVRRAIETGADCRTIVSEFPGFHPPPKA